MSDLCVFGFISVAYLVGLNFGNDLIFNNSITNISFPPDVALGDGVSEWRNVHNFDIVPWKNSANKIMLKFHINCVTYKELWTSEYFLRLPSIAESTHSFCNHVKSVTIELRNEEFL
jgi:hypothetical protein